MKRTLLPGVVAALAVGLLATSAVGAAQRAGKVVLPPCPANTPKLSSHGAPSSPFVRRGPGLVRLCRYSSVTWGVSGRLQSQRLIGKSATIAYLTRSFNALQEPPRGIFCVKDNGSEILVMFGYAGAKPELVATRLTGCRFSSNGKATRSTTTPLYNRLKALTT